MTAALSPYSFGNFFTQAVSHLLGILFAQGPEAPGRETDRRLVEEALAGDPGFERLVRAYEAMVYRTAFRFMGQEADALDVTQEVFLRVHRSLPGFKGESALSTWIYAITANLSKNALRSRKNRGKLQVLAPAGRGEEEGDWLGQAPDKKKPAALDLAESEQFGQAFQKALKDLPPDFKEAVILRDLEGLDYGQIAGILKLGLGTVKSRIARGRGLLRERLKDWV
ncbi:MAG TPA: sigma-70 family RNA polymerase sigma factor [bacterium]|nr:sigma-70 family RNA polymerase sigma factor [bacterium]